MTSSGVRRWFRALILGDERVEGLESRVSRGRRRWATYAGSLAMVAAVTSVGFQIEHVTAPTNLAMLYLLCVVVSSLRWGLGQAALCAVASALVFDYFFLPSPGIFVFADGWYLITFLTLLGVGLLISTLASEARAQAYRARRREAHATAMYNLSRSLIAAADLNQIVAAVADHMIHAFRRPIVLALASDGGKGPRFQSPEFDYSETERTAAAWVMKHGRQAGRSTNFFPTARGFYLPLKTAWGVEGVAGLQADEQRPWLSAEQQQVLQDSVSRAALAIERALIEDKAQQAQLIQERERMQKALLNSVSHNLRTPLASISGTLSSLLEEDAVFDQATRAELLGNALEQSVRLNRLVANLLDVSRLEAGTLQVRMEPCEAQDVVGAALAQLGAAIAKHRISVDIGPNLPLVPMDFVLISQVVVNLVENAARYSPAGGSIDIRIRAAGDWLETTVADSGSGIAEGKLESVFERFNGSRGSRREGGVGLGLYISKGFVEAHGGRIWAERGVPRGARITFRIPIALENAGFVPETEQLTFS